MTGRAGSQEQDAGTPLAIACRGLQFFYSGGNGIEVNRLSIEQGRIVAILGPNGSGKSTLLWLLAGLRRPDSGQISLLGNSAADSKHMRQRVTLLMEQPYLLRTSVQANIEYGLRQRGLDRKLRRLKAVEALKVVGLEGFEQRKVWQLSQGEQKRVALARAMVLETPLLLLDEPTMHVDRQSAERIEATVEAQRGRRTVVFSTHDLGQARRLADEVVTMVGGKISPVSHENLFHFADLPSARAGIERVFDKLDWSRAAPDGPVDVLIDPAAIRLDNATPDASTLRIVQLAAERNSVRVVLEGELSLVARIEADQFDPESLALGRAMKVSLGELGLHVISARR